MENYLKTIFALSQIRGYARISEIAKDLHISPSSAVEMIGNITALLLVMWKRYEDVFLTPEVMVHGEIIHKPDIQFKSTVSFNISPLTVFR
ncbi:metal-dependent transcriptional regulator [Methanospirillum sp.]|uniref:metal-dependent transcriptional regulator n=1 Tax=Methanospirillum sp. TaxID=45200 RepID=UPI0039C9D88D